MPRLYSKGKIRPWHVLSQDPKYQQSFFHFPAVLSGHLKYLYMKFRLWTGLLWWLYLVLMNCSLPLLYQYYWELLCYFTKNIAFYWLEETTEMCIMSFVSLFFLLAPLPFYFKLVKNGKFKKEQLLLLKYKVQLVIVYHLKYCLINMCFICGVDLHVHANIFGF